MSDNASDQRLMLTQIELENFKSYYGRRIIGPFHKRFSSIVGPNGSGKSNVIDALLFVFGRRAKQIRLKKIGELVHNSDKHQNCSQARVTIHFQDIIDNESSEDDFEVVPNSQFTVSRVVTKSSSSQYLINGKACSLKDVTELLISKGIDLSNNRFLILQGEVESISLMKPKGVSPGEEGLLEYLEDIIGSNKYVDQIATASEEVDTLNAEVQERLNRVKVVERDREKLESSKDEAEEYIRAELQQWKLEGVRKQLEMNRYEQRKISVNEELQRIDENMQQFKDTQDALQTELQDCEQEYQEIRTERERLHSEMKESEDRFHETEQRDTTAKEKGKHLKDQKKRVSKNLQKLVQSVEEMESTVEKNGETIPKLEAKNEKLALEIEEATEKANQMREELQARTAPIREAMEEKQKELIPLKDRENELKQQWDEIRQDIQTIELKGQAAQIRRQELQDKAAKLDQELQAKEQEYNAKDTELKQMEKDYTRMENESRNCEMEEKKCEQELQSARQNYEDAKRAHNAQGGNRDRIVNALLQAQESGALSGIIGRLGALGTIAEEYDVAVSTASWGTLHNILVEKVHHAQRAVEFLKRNQLGTATFLILEKQKHLERRMGGVNTPENVPRIFDLIRPSEDRFRCAFYFALRDTLVADSLDQANRLAFNSGRRWRVVSKQGALIEATGAMTGGGKQVYRGAMSSVALSQGGITEQQLQQMHDDVQRLNNRCNQLRSQRRDLTKQLKSCQRMADKARVALRKLQLAVESLQERKRDVEEQIPEFQEDSKLDEEDEARLAQLKEEVQQKQRAFELAEEDCESLEDEIKSLSEQIYDEGGKTLKDEHAEIKSKETKLKKNGKQITQMRVEIEKCTKKLKNSGKKRSDLEKELATIETQLEENKALRARYVNEGAEAMQLYETTKEEWQKIEGSWKAIETKVRKKEEKLNKVKTQIVNLEESHKNHSTEIKALSQRISKLTKEFKITSTRFDKLKTELFVVDEVDDSSEKDKSASAPAPVPDTDETKEETTEAQPMEVDTEAETETENRDAEADADGDVSMADGSNEADSAASADAPASASAAAAASSGVADVNQLSVSVYLDESYVEQMIFLTADQLSEIDDVKAINDEMEAVKRRLQSVKVNMGAIEAYRAKDEEYVRRLHDLQQCKDEREAKRKEFESFKKQRYDQFMAGYEIITRRLKEMYRMLTCGGDAELELVDSIDPFAEGVSFSVRPPKKSWKNISNLSGGEKTLSSMALVFALHHFKPTPLYVMDEIDAALDFKNVSIVANYINSRTKNAQFVIISLRNNMFELANRLVGIYKTFDCSKSITINPTLFHVPNHNNANAAAAANANAGGVASTTMATAANATQQSQNGMNHHSSPHYHKSKVSSQSNNDNTSVVDTEV